MTDVLRPIGWELAERYPEIYRDPPVIWDHRSICPVCGHPTGDCTREDHENMVSAQENRVAAADPVRTAYQGGHPTAAEAVSISAERIGPGPDLVVVKEEVWEEVTDPQATTKRRRLKYAKGQVITADEARENKVTAVQQQDLTAGSTK